MYLFICMQQYPPVHFKSIIIELNHQCCDMALCRQFVNALYCENQRHSTPRREKKTTSKWNDLISSRYGKTSFYMHTAYVRMRYLRSGYVFEMLQMPVWFRLASLFNQQIAKIWYARVCSLICYICIYWNAIPIPKCHSCSQRNIGWVPWC